MNTFQETENSVVRESIFEAFLSLLSEKKFSKITVTEIARKAGVSRMAYYRNFLSKEDIITGYLDDLFFAYQLEVLGEKNNLIHATTLFFSFFRKYGNTLKNFNDSSLMFLMSKRFESYLRHLLMCFDHKKNFQSQDYVFTLAFISGGMFNLLFTWIKDDLKGTDEEMGAYLADLLKVILE